MGKKKVLFIITKSNFGGAQRYVYDIATALPKDSYDPVVAFGGTGAPNSAAGKLDAMLSEVHIPTRFIESFIRDISFFKEFAALKELVSLIRKEQPDIVHLNSSKAGGIGALAARMVGVKKIVLTVHGWAYNEPVSKISKLFRWVASLVTALLAHDVISVSHFDALHAPLGLKTTVIHNGIDVPHFEEREVARRRLTALAPITEDALLIGTIAELHYNKGLDTLIAALATFPKAQAVIVGSDGGSQAYLEHLIEKYELKHRVHLTGFISEARTLLKGFDIFVLPSRKEGLPYTILEAGAAKLPVVSTTVGGIPEIIQDGVSGELVTPDDVGGLADALKCLYQNPNTRARYAEALKEKVSRYFNLRGMVKKTIEVYER